MSRLELLRNCPACGRPKLSILASRCPDCDFPMQPKIGSLPGRRAPDRQKLRTCPACGHRPISTMAESCSECGHPISTGSHWKKMEAWARLIIPIAALAISGLGFWVSLETRDRELERTARD